MSLYPVYTFALEENDGFSMCSTNLRFYRPPRGNSTSMKLNGTPKFHVIVLNQAISLTQRRKIVHTRGTATVELPKFVDSY